MRIWIRKLEHQISREMPRIFDLDILNGLTVFQRHVLSSPFSFNLLSKEDASL
jgi:hypothetical protein